MKRDMNLICQCQLLAHVECKQTEGPVEIPTIQGGRLRRREGPNGVPTSCWSTLQYSDLGLALAAIIGLGWWGVSALTGGGEPELQGPGQASDDKGVQRKA